MQQNNLKNLAQLVRYYSLISTTAAGSGHPTSALSAADLMTVLMFGEFFRADLSNPKYPNNDRLIFSKGHASPLLYSLYAAASKIREKELLRLRTFGSVLEGHPVMEFPYTEAATGSLGQGLSVGVGMAINAKYIDKLPYRTYVLLGDSEMAEGSVWEAMQIASYYKLDNLIGILDVNRLGQRGPTMYEHNMLVYKKRAESFGWKTLLVNGHDISEILHAYKKALQIKKSPTLIIAKTFKGKGIKFLENKDGWHGKALKNDELQNALKDLGRVDTKLRGKVAKPLKLKAQNPKFKSKKLPATSYKLGDNVATRQAYGDALVSIFPEYKDKIVVLDGEVSNSTYAENFQKIFPKRFFEMFIAEQNMVGTAIGLSRMRKIPFVSTFAAFFTRAFDQIRMSRYSESNIKFCGSHAGVSIGEDGPSQMGLEDIALFRTLLGSVVLYPSDAVSTTKLVSEMARHQGIAYMRTTRSKTPILYKNTELFPIGGSKVLKKSLRDDVTLIACGITLFESLKAHDELKKIRINARVIDLYSVKPLDLKTLSAAVRETKALITIEDHYAEGGVGEAVQSALTGASMYSLCVRKMPKSGKPQELLDYEEISASAIVERAKKVLGK